MKPGVLKPTVSLVILNYNREAYLAEAIASVLAQTYADFELLIWDDGSTDRSLEIAQDYAQRDRRVRVVAAAHQGGCVAKARKRAIAQTQGTYLGWVDSDDRLSPSALERTVAVLAGRPDIGMVYTDYQTMDEAGTLSGYGHRCTLPYSRDRLLLDFITFHFRLLRRSVYDSIGGIDDSYAYAYDYDLCLRLSEATEVHHLPLPLYDYRHHAKANSSTRALQQTQWSRIAVERALVRRGLGDRLSLEVQMCPDTTTWNPQFRLLAKTAYRLQSLQVPALQQMAAWVALPLTLTLGAIATPSLSPAAFAQAITPAPDGTGTRVNQTGNQYTITGGSTSGNGRNLFHSLQRLGLSSAEIANFQANPALQNILTRVVGGDASVIDGLLRVSGGDANLFIINPAGIIFGSNAQLDLNGSFMATTATGIGFSNGWFNVAGTPEYQNLVGAPAQFAFATATPGTLLNAGTLAVPPGETLTLMGGTVVNTGSLSAPGGAITLAAIPGGNRVRLSQPGSLLSLDLQPITGAAANGITGLPFTPLSLPELLTGGSVTVATGLQTLANGTVRLVDSALTIPTAAGTAIGAGSLSVATQAATGSSAISPSITVVGDRVALVEATLNADGANGGGTIRVGGDFQGNSALPTAQNTVITSGSTLSANATVEGNGGRVIVWADGLTAFGGTINAQGINGDGGFVEVSGATDLLFQGLVDVRAVNGAIGTLLLDPTNILIDRVASAPNPIAINAALPTILAGDFLGQDITLDAVFLEAQSAAIVLEATNNITIAPGVNLNFGSTTGGGLIRFTADSDGNGVGDFVMDSADNFFTAGRNLTITGAGIQAGNIDLTGSFTGTSGNLRLEARDFITVGNIIATGGGYGFDQAGNVRLINPTGSIQVESINASSGTGNGGNGGTVVLNGDLIQVAANIAATGGNITIIHRGGPLNAPFTVGTANPTNGVGGLITTGIGEVDSGSYPVLSAGGDAILPVGSDNITLRSVNQAPQIFTTAPVFITLKDQAIQIPILSLGIDRVDGNEDSVFVRILASSIPAGAILTVNGVPVVSNVIVNLDTDVLEFTPPPGFVGTLDAFQLDASDLTDGAPLLSTSSPVAIQVRVNEAPDHNGGNDGNGDDGGTIINPIDSPIRIDRPTFTQPLDPIEPGDSNTSIDCCVNSTERQYNQEFGEYLGVTPLTVATEEDGQTIAQTIEEATGIRPAFVYINFVPPELIVRSANPTPQDTDQLELLVVSAEGTLRRRVTGVTRAEVMAIARSFRNEITTPRNVRNTNYLEPAQQLYGWLIAPILADLQGLEIDNLVFLPEAGLRSLPYAALHDGQQFLIEQYSVGIMPSLSLTDTRYVDIRDTEILAMGIAESTQGQAPLPAVPLEVNTLAFKLWRGQAFLNARSTLTNLQQAREIQPYGIIHLATHADFVAGDIGQSYIQFWNERLHLDEIRQLGWNDPPVELLVLSACRTALGDERAELGFAGLAVQSGVKSAIASLWYVSDAATAGLMARFYESLRVAPIKAEALRQAQLGMARGEVYVDAAGRLQGVGEVNGLQLPIDSTRDVLGQPLSHPYYWAAFTMIGNPW